MVYDTTRSLSMKIILTLGVCYVSFNVWELPCIVEIKIPTLMIADINLLKLILHPHNHDIVWF